LRDFSSTGKNDRSRFEIDGFNLDEAVSTHSHTDVLETNLHLLVGETHGGETDIVLANASSNVVGDDLFDKLASASRRVHTVSDGTGEGSERSEVRVGVNRVRIS